MERDNLNSNSKLRDAIRGRGTREPASLCKLLVGRRGSQSGDSLGESKVRKDFFVFWQDFQILELLFLFFFSLSPHHSAHLLQTPQIYYDNVRLQFPLFSVRFRRYSSLWASSWVLLSPFSFDLHFLSPLTVGSALDWLLVWLTT